jgi:hypothetical protein
VIERDFTVTLTPEDVELYNRARAINLPTIVMSMYGDRIKMLLDEEREACAKVCEETDDGTPYNLAEECARNIRARGQA